MEWVRWVPDVRPIEVVNLFVTIGVGVWLNYAWKKQQSALQVEKDVVVKIVGEVGEYCRQAETAAEGATEKARKAALGSFRKASNAIGMLGDVMSDCEDKRIQEMHRDVDRLSDAYELLKKAVTGGNFPTKPPKMQQTAEIAQASRELHSKVYKLQRKVSVLQ